MFLVTNWNVIEVHWIGFHILQCQRFKVLLLNDPNSTQQAGVKVVDILKIIMYL